MGCILDSWYSYNEVKQNLNHMHDLNIPWHFIAVTSQAGRTDEWTDTRMDRPHLCSPKINKNKINHDIDYHNDRKSQLSLEALYESIGQVEVV